ncbi:hypothetical protein FHX74_001008 [Friedmanniella endophytica]|uniref:Uncharacterized protein n=1 Tax=Microlunatus kandeliicorticis TaxID=1759536 RepID=A0A7W3IQJ9_9ACTN|nr:hypothetical protein [Microlunatus kandeliicorticis]MBA8793403.1 hypothetical protein [Microlunatus kandeliicorticis]
MNKPLRTCLALGLGAAGVIGSLGSSPLTADAAPQQSVTAAHQVRMSKRISCETRTVKVGGNYQAQARCRGMNFFATFYVTAGCSNRRYVTGGPYAVPHLGSWSSWRGVSCGRNRVAWMNASL